VKALQDFGYGPNLAHSEHDEWRKHRRIAGPSFTESNNILVWESTIEIILEYFIKWNHGSIVKVSNLTEVTTQIAFMVFATAGVWSTWEMNIKWLIKCLLRLWHQCELGLGQE
jgi:cytochrome P450